MDAPEFSTHFPRDYVNVPKTRPSKDSPGDPALRVHTSTIFAIFNNPATVVGWLTLGTHNVGFSGQAM